MRVVGCELWVVDGGGGGDGVVLEGGFGRKLEVAPIPVVDVGVGGFCKSEVVIWGSLGRR